MMRSDLHITLADDTDIGYAEVGESDGPRCCTCTAAQVAAWR